jgi:hypothetical protein
MEQQASRIPQPFRGSKLDVLEEFFPLLHLTSQGHT